MITGTQFDGKLLNRLTPNDPYTGRTAPLTSKRCILYIYLTNMGTEHFKHSLYFPFFFSLQNAVCFIMLTCLVPVVFTFYIQDVLKLKNNSGAKGLNTLLDTQCELSLFTKPRQVHSVRLCMKTHNETV